MSELRALADELDEPQRRDPALLVDAERAWLDGRLADLLGRARRRRRGCDRARRPGCLEIVWWIRRADPSYPAPDATGPYRAGAEASLAEAATYWQGLGCPYEAAITLLDGDEAELRAALTAFDRLGAAPGRERSRAGG